MRVVWIRHFWSKTSILSWIVDIRSIVLSNLLYNNNRFAVAWKILKQSFEEFLQKNVIYFDESEASQIAKLRSCIAKPTCGYVCQSTTPTGMRRGDPRCRGVGAEVGT